MEKRFVGFLLASLLVIVGYSLLRQELFPPPPADLDPIAAQPGAAEVEGDRDFRQIQGPEVAEPVAQPDRHTEVPPSDTASAQAGVESEAPQPIEPKDIPLQRFTLGSADPNSPYRMQVTVTNRGAAIEYVALNSPKYLDVDNKSGYLGYLALMDDSQRNGCRVGVVGPGTPAAEAVPKSIGTAPGLRGPTFRRQDDGSIELDSVGDLITEMDRQPIANVAEFEQRLRDTRPGQEIELTVQRQSGEQVETIAFAIFLVRRPLEVLRPEPQATMDRNEPYPPSFLLSLTQIGNKSAGAGVDEIPGLPSMRNSHWDAVPINGPEGPGVEFRLLLSDADLNQIGQSGNLEIIKRFRLATVPEEEAANAAYRAFHLTFEIEIRNGGKTAQQFAYQLQGPTGLVLEGWWYSYKFRDVAWKSPARKVELFNTAKIVKQAKAAYEDGTNESPDTPLSAGSEAPMEFAGCDATYFAAVLLAADKRSTAGEPSGDSSLVLDSAVAGIVAELDKNHATKRTDVTFRLTSQPKTIQPTEVYRQRFEIFAGPKQVDVLEQYGLGDLIVFGWFGAIARPMTGILHFFYGLVGNYGLAVVLLTVLVRGCMFPLGRKMALNAQKMQELAPEMKRIAEKYKKDMEKRTQAQRELFRKNSYNPFGGCLLMFLQLPIFIGLYRGLSVDIELRQALLIPGLSWCSNLAAPDQLWHWTNYLPAFIAGYGGWLGPYLNVLPLVTCGLFMMHQKLFTPPAADEQQQMQQQVMKFMMIFMAFMFFRVAAGLCIYFIASSLWGLGERLLLPKPKIKTSDEVVTKPIPQTSGNGNGKTTAKTRRKKQKRR